MGNIILVSVSYMIMGIFWGTALYAASQKYEIKESFFGAFTIVGRKEGCQHDMLATMIYPLEPRGSERKECNTVLEGPCEAKPGKGMSLLQLVLLNIVGWPATLGRILIGHLIALFRKLS